MRHPKIVTKRFSTLREHRYEIFSFIFFNLLSKIFNLHTLQDVIEISNTARNNLLLYYIL